MTAALFSTILFSSCSWQIGNSGHKYSSCEEGGGQFVTRSKQLSMRTKSQLTWNGRHSCVVRPQKQLNPQDNENKMIVWVMKSTFAILQMVFPTSTSGGSRPVLCVKEWQCYNPTIQGEQVIQPSIWTLNNKARFKLCSHLVSSCIKQFAQAASEQTFYPK